MIKPVLLIDSVHAEVLDRTAGATQAHIDIKIDSVEFSKDEKRLTLRYRLIKTTRFARTSVEGTLTLYAENTDLELLEKIAHPREEKPPPNLILEIIILKTQPLVLHIEDMLGVPPIPIPPPPPLPKKRPRTRRDRDYLLYQ